MLSPERAARIERCRKRWISASLSAGPVDRSAAEAALFAAYRNAGLPRPETIVWHEGPSTIERDWTEMSERIDTGRRLKDDIFFQPQAVATGFVRAQIGHVADAEINALMHPGTVDPFGDVMGRNIDFRPAPSRMGWLRRRGRGLIDAFRPASGFRRLNFWYRSFGQNYYAWLAPFDYARRELGLTQQTDCVAPVLDLAQTTGWVLPFEKICWVSDRPSVLKLDETERLHSASGPALAYNDGSEWYAWKGVPLPAWVVDRPGNITARLIESQPDPVIRRCLIDIMTPEAYIASSRAQCVSEDETGRLWQRSWPEIGADGWAAVEVVNGTAEPDGTFKHYFLQVPYAMRSARAAVAWTYGLSEDQYKHLQFRT